MSGRGHPTGAGRPGLVDPARRDAVGRLVRAGLAAGLAGPSALAWANAPAIVPPGEVAAELPGARLRGQGRLRFLGLHVYDARLWVPPGFDPGGFVRSGLALELLYARRLVGRLIAERSLDEMRRVPGMSDAQAAGWLEAMKGVFPDVAEGDRLTGLNRAGAATRFFHNGRLVGEIADPEFTQRFFAIWLGSQTSQPQLRLALLGERP